MSSRQTSTTKLLSGIRSRLSQGVPYYDRWRPGNPSPPKPASLEVINRAENELGFGLPFNLKSCLQQIANGGFGPAYGLIGLDGGHLDSFGRSLVQGVSHLSNFRLMGKTGSWTELVPVWEWGAGVTICVQGNDTDESLYVVDEHGITRTPVSFSDAMWNWIRLDKSDDLMFEFRKVFRPNPFGGPPIEVTGSRVAKGELVGWFSAE